MNPDGFDLLLRFSLAGSVAVVAVLLLRHWLHHRCGARSAYAAWMLVPASLLAMLLPAPVVTDPGAALAWQIQPLRAAAAAALTPAGASDPREVLMLVWMMGVLLALVAFARQQWRFLRSLGRLRARSPARTLHSDSSFVGPAVVGIWRPNIVLPADFEQRYSAHERDLILAHEQVHLMRGDAIINAMVVSLRALNWFNPLLHYAAAVFRLDQELACDAAVLTRFPEARRRYADAMLKVQLAGQARQELRLPVGCQWPSDRTLKERILMLKQPSPTRAMRRFGLGLVVAITLAGAWTAWASQPPRAASDNPQSPAATMPDGADGDSGISTEAAPPVPPVPPVPSVPPVPPVPPVAPVAAPPPPPAPPALSGPGYRALSPPKYPPAAIKQGIEGIQYIQTKVGRDGHVLDAKLDHAIPATSAGLLGPAAVAAVKTWTFDPARQGDTAVDSQVMVPVRFALSNKPVETPPPGPGELDIIVVTGTILD